MRNSKFREGLFAATIFVGGIVLSGCGDSTTVVTPAAPSTTTIKEHTTVLGAPVAPAKTEVNVTTPAPVVQPAKTEVNVTTPEAHPPGH